ncbi:Crp/Fnr family transcriptional regulator [Paenibacillus sp. PK3_47]|uniref:Crp/Fnr family transcriptional regulator n=1 Tax=Paenibacillus sp. PK3_47 TaxID=2072642 RepID=UPI00201DE5D7|nr:Crp/Fnr family transcriptional regulator [Paenibacillus sp. PK3_47]
MESIIESNYYAKGSVVFREGEPSESLFVVKSGLIKLTQTNKEGKQHTLRFLFPGDYFGQFALLHNKQNHVKAEVIEGSDVCRLHRKDFLPLVERNSALAFSFLMSMSEQLQQAEELAGAMHIFEVEKRLARLLVQLLSRKQSGLIPQSLEMSIELPAAKKEFAAMIGTTAETLSRKLNKLESLHIIEMRKRTVEVLDIQALYQMAEISK